MKDTTKIGILFLIIGFLYLSCGSDKPVEPTDQVKPTILSTYPSDNVIDIPIDTFITIVFSEKIASSSVNANSVDLILADTLNSDPVSVSYNLNDSTLMITPLSHLFYDSTYFVRIRTSITDLSGNSLNNEKIIAFTTEPDPISLPPVVLGVQPANNSTGISIDTNIVITFSKPIDISSVNSSTFVISGGITGQYFVSGNTITFVPNGNFEYDSTYNITLTASITDTYGLYLENVFNSSFRTVSLTPQAIIAYPQDSVIVGDTTFIQVFADHPIGIDSVQFYLDNNPSPEFTTFTEPYELLLDGSGFALASEHFVYAIAYGSDRPGYTDSLNFFYLWQEYIGNDDEGLFPVDVPNDLRRMLARTTDTTLELRFEYATNWQSVYADTNCTRIYNCGIEEDTVYCSDTAIDLAIYIDSDLSPLTGRLDGAGDTLNGIGADYRVLLGLHGGDTCLSLWNPDTWNPDRNSYGIWELIGDTTALFYHNAPINSNYIEIGIIWSDIGDPSAVDIVNINVFFRNYCDPNDFLVDLMPDRHYGYLRIIRRNQFLGKISPFGIKKKSTTFVIPSQNIKKHPNPFE